MREPPVRMIYYRAREQRERHVHMALNRKLDVALDALLQQAIEEQRAVNPNLFDVPQPLSEAVSEQLLRDEAELQQTWDEMDRTRGNAPRHMTGAEAVDQDRGE